MRGEAEPAQDDQTASHSPDRIPMQPGTEPYYLAHFMQVLRSVAARYGFLLSEAEHRHIERLHGLTAPARMLYARLVNRRGPCFRVDKLRYPEIPALDDALAELQGAGLLCAGTQGEAWTEADLALRCFTLPELRLELRHPGLSPPRGRAALLDWLRDWDERPDWLTGLLGRHRVIRLPKTDPWPFLRFLFFGELRDNLSDFVIRELGFLTLEDITPEEIAVRFRSRAEATDAFRMAGLYAEFRLIRDLQSARDTLSWWQSQGITRETLTAGADVFDRLIDRLGRRLEREREPALALALYASSQHGMTRERQVRLLIKEGQRTEAIRLAEAILDAPHSTEEAYAARHLLRRMARNRQTSDARRLQKMGRTIQLQNRSNTVELATLMHYRALGWDGVHAENWLWNATFGLLLWDIIYDTSLGTFHSPLQTSPSDLYDRQFYVRRACLIEQRLATLQQDGAAWILAEKTFHRKHGLTNPFVYWDAHVLTCVQVLIDRLPAQGLAAILRRFAQDVRNHARGFPDLFLWTANDYSFVEVKSETDQLSPAQYEWLAFFEECGIRAYIDNVMQI